MARRWCAWRSSADRRRFSSTASLRQHEKRKGGGRAYPDNVGFIVDLPRRKSFSPDVAFHLSTTPTMKFVEGAPVFAAEVRS